jgi:hypothetical protein
LQIKAEAVHPVCVGNANGLDPFFSENIEK